MKILFVFNFAHPDYLADSVYHGLIDSGCEVFETSYPRYMMKDFYDPNFYGRGFTLYSKLNHSPRLESEEIIKQKIKWKFYDLIIYGCVYTHHWVPNRQCLDYLDLVREYYPRTKIHFLDGSDDTTNFSQEYNLDQYGIIWKRELTDYFYGNPISFAIPESQIRSNFYEKNEIFSSKIIKPVANSYSDPKKYTFTDEKEYYDAYSKAYYGFTTKKGGWDCMRHYEILANKTIPAFYDLENCPATILTDFPKNIILEINKYSLIDQVHSDYHDFNEWLFKYTKENLTTKKLIERFL